MQADTATYEGFKEGVCDPDPAVRALAAACLDAPPEILYYLAQDADVEVRRRVAANPATPVAANVMLTQDPDHSVRCEIAYKAVGEGLDAKERTKMLRMGLTILETLATDQVVRVRTALAEAIKSVAEAPRQIIRLLAGDGCEAVASPVLQNSPVLTDDDLLEILADNPPEWAQTAIARREIVSPRVVEVIVEAGSPAPTAALIGNEGAKIAEPVLERIVEQATTQTDWQAPLAQRESMPPRLLLRLVSFVAAPVLALLRQRKDLSDDLTQELVLRERSSVAPVAVQTAVRTSESPKAEDGRDSADEAALTAEQEERARAVNMFRAGKLDDDTVAAALDNSKDAFVTVALALRAGLTLGAVQHILAAKNAEVVTALVWKSGMSMRFAMDVQKFLAHVPLREVLNARGGVDYPLGPDKMTMLLDVFGD